jgi:hypothetical protein
MAVISRGAGRLAQLPVPPLPERRRATPWVAPLLGCLAVAALTLLWADRNTYDPTAWLIWGREIVHLDLVTTNGPSWKPLPVLFTTPFALLGSTLAPLLWLVVARAGGLFAFVLVYRLAARLAGPWAGAIAVASVVLEDVFLYHFARGNSEGLLAAAVLWAIERHLDGHPRSAFALGLAAGLIRPELWAFVGVYGLWLLLASPPARRPFALVLGGGALMVLLWFVPEYLGSGNLFRAASRALQPVPDSPAQAAFPFGATFTNAASALLLPTYVGGVAAVVLAVRRRDRTVLALAGFATLLMLSVAAGAEIGFTGNQRYVTLPAAIACILAGVGWTQLFALARGRWSAGVAWALAAVAVLASAPYLHHGELRLRARLSQVRYENRHDHLLEAVIDRVGKERLLSCGRLYVGEFDTQVVVYALRLHDVDVGDEQISIAPGQATVIAPDNSHLATDPRFGRILRTPRWTVVSTCARS